MFAGVCVCAEVLTRVVRLLHEREGETSCVREKECGHGREGMRERRNVARCVGEKECSSRCGREGMRLRV